jgi:hypothetical protein
MIQATDLRIGNWVNNDDLGNTQVDEIYNNSVVRVWSNADYFYIGEESINPIPLTPDILEKCGFVFNERSSSYRIFSHKEEWILAAQQTADKTCFKIGLPIDGRSDQYMTNLTYLNELQNLYKALTNNELTINL